MHRILGFAWERNLGDSMNRTLLSLATIASVLALGACATDIPIPTGNPQGEQVKLRAPQHWDLVARDIAKQTKNATDRVGELRGVYVRRPDGASAFEAAMFEFVSTRMLELGVPVRLAPENALIVDYNTMLVQHASDRSTVSIPLVALAAGIMAGYNVAEHGNSFWQSAAGLGAIAGFDYMTGRLRSGGAPSKTELIVTTSISTEFQFLMRKTDVYYIDDADLSLFLRQQVYRAPTRTFIVDGGKR